jgi:WS/DGAT/MGAT family acyltransferase
MQQLTELDYTFLQQESHRTPMHISPVIVYETRGRKGGAVRFKEILQVFEQNLSKSAIFRRKLAGGALGLDTPWWVDDPEFDLEFHVRHIALPKPGDWRQFCILLARLHARGLDVHRPLWEAYVIEGLSQVEGLPKNSFALMLKVHHAAIDGVSAAEIIAAIHSLTREAAAPEPAAPWRGERNPSALKVWSTAYLNNIRRPLRFLESVRTLVPAAIRARELESTGMGMEKAAQRHTLFNERISAFRVTDAIVMDLARIKTIKNTVEGATVNDVIVSIVGGGLRQYLQSRDGLPESSLICGAPINVRQERNSQSRGNQVSMMTIDMATDVEDALDRLRQVAANARESKAYASALGAHAMMDLTRGLLPAAVGMGLRAASLASLLGDLPIPIQTVISNVPGPQAPLYLAGARVHFIMGMGPLMDMMGLFHGVISAAGKITINFVSCREIMPDPEFYRKCLQTSFEELSAASSK